MKAIFLDVDGVLNSAARWRELEDEIDPLAVALLKQLVDETDARIVVSSAWRIFKLHELTDILTAAGIAAERIIGATPQLDTGVSQIRLGAPRCVEIRAWLDEHPEVDRFVILDDDEGASIDGHFVRTTWDHGLEPQHVERAKGILGVEVPA